MIEHVLAGVSMFFQQNVLLGTAAGVVLGILLGMIPGLTGAVAMALTIPLTFRLHTLISLGILVGIYKGAVYGGSIPAILVAAPGTPEAAATVLDGFELRKQGKAQRALSAALYSSVIGDLFSDLMLILVAMPLGSIAIKFGPPELTMVMILAFVIIGGVTQGSVIKGLIAVVLGLLFATVGLDPILATRRFAFGFIELDSGLDYVAMLIGLFAISEVIIQAGSVVAPAKKSKSIQASIRPESDRFSFRELKQHGWLILQSSLIGSFIGALPGLGSTIAAFLSYGAAKKTSKNSKNFGKGSIEGVIAPEVANNATTGAALIPLITLGIPGSALCAILMGAFLIHDVIPGPLMFEKNLDLIYGLFCTLIFASMVSLPVGYCAIRLSKSIVGISNRILFPIVLCLCIVGSYAINSSMFDVRIMLMFGVIGYVMRKFEFPLAPFLIAFIIGPLAERNIRQSLILSGGSLGIFFDHPIALGLLILIGIVIAMSIITSIIKGRKRAKIT